MTDYLEEHLEQAGALLEELRQLERGTLLPGGSADREEAEDAFPKDQENTASEEEKQIVSEKEGKVDSLKTEIDQVQKTVDNMGFALENQVEDTENSVYRKDELVDDPQTLMQEEEKDALEQDAGGDAEAGRAPTNEERAKKSSVPLAVRLEELDRAVSMLTAALPEEQNTDRVLWSAGRRQGAPLASLRGVTAQSGTAAAAERGMERGSLSAGDGLRWAEEADRVFRRDSRRYDGGFYLY